MVFLPSKFGLSDGTLASVIAVTQLPAGTVRPASFCPLLMTRIMQIVIASDLPRSGKGKNLESSYNNSGLDEWGKSVGKGETIGLASIFGGTSIY
jgi:hypothetical protein